MAEATVEQAEIVTAQESIKSDFNKRVVLVMSQLRDQHLPYNPSFEISQVSNKERGRFETLKGIFGYPNTKDNEEQLLDSGITLLYKVINNHTDPIHLLGVDRTSNNKVAEDQQKFGAELISKLGFSNNELEAISESIKYAASAMDYIKSQLEKSFGMLLESKENAKFTEQVVTEVGKKVKNSVVNLDDPDFHLRVEELCSYENIENLKQQVFSKIIGIENTSIYTNTYGASLDFIERGTQIENIRDILEFISTQYHLNPESDKSYEHSHAQKLLETAMFVVSRTDLYPEFKNKENFHELLIAFKNAYDTGVINIVSPSCPGYKDEEVESSDPNHKGKKVRKIKMELGEQTSIPAKKIMDCHIPLMVELAKRGVQVNWNVGVAVFEAATYRNKDYEMAITDEEKRIAIEKFSNMNNIGLKIYADEVIGRFNTDTQNLRVMGLEKSEFHSKDLDFDFANYNMFLIAEGIPAPINVHIGVLEQVMGNQFIKDVESEKKELETLANSEELKEALKAEFKWRSAFYKNSLEAKDEELWQKFLIDLSEYSVMARILGSNKSFTALGDSDAMWSAARKYNETFQRGKSFPIVFAHQTRDKVVY